MSKKVYRIGKITADGRLEMGNDDLDHYPTAEDAKKPTFPVKDCKFYDCRKHKPPAHLNIREQYEWIQKEMKKFFEKE